MKRNYFADRVFRCGESDFYRDEILHANETHTDERLKRIAGAGFNGIWLRAVLRDLTPGKLFADSVQNADLRLDSLKKLCLRAKKHGLGVWLFAHEPLGLRCDDPFWKTHPHLRGHRTAILDDPPEYALCTSTQEVQDFLQDGFYTLFKKAHLAGTMLITASEHVSHCWGHVLTNPNFPCPESFWAHECQCPRCSQRDPVSIISEIIHTIHRGVKEAQPKARIVAWDWSWNMYVDPPYRKLIDRLPDDVILMGDFERGGKTIQNGKPRMVEEYSLAYPGPSPRFRGEVNYIKGKRPIWAKLQVNTTHELATVPNLPLVVSLYRKFRYLRQARAGGYMATWNFACEPKTLNIFAVDMLSKEPAIPTQWDWLKSLAERYFGPRVDVAGIVRAWCGFFRAFRSFPINGFLFVYWSPINYSLVYPLSLKFKGRPMGICCVKPEVYGDRLEDSFGSLTLTEIVNLLGNLSRTWADAVRIYERALQPVDSQPRSRQEFAVAKVASGCFRSTFNIYRWYQSRKKRQNVAINAKEREIIHDEIANLEEVLPFVGVHPLIGYHQECQSYFFTAQEIQ